MGWSEGPGPGGWRSKPPGSTWCALRCVSAGSGDRTA